MCRINTVYNIASTHFSTACMPTSMAPTNAVIRQQYITVAYDYMSSCLYSSTTGYPSLMGITYTIIFAPTTHPSPYLTQAAACRLTTCCLAAGHMLVLHDLRCMHCCLTNTGSENKKYQLSCPAQKFFAPKSMPGAPELP